MNQALVDNIQFFVNLFTSIVWEAMPFIVLGAIVAGVLEELLPQQLIGRILPKSPYPAVILGGLLGLVFPMCECGIIVVMRRLLRKGLPLSCCVAYMLAGPIVNVVVLFSTWVAFFNHSYVPGNPESGSLGPTMVLLRAGMGFVVACVTGIVVHRLEVKRGTNSLLIDMAAPTKGVALTVVEGDEKPAPRKSVFQRLNAISETALHDFIDIMMFLILGAFLAALVKLYVSPNTVETFSAHYPYLAIPAMMLLAVLMCLCSEADAFVAASFTEASISSKLAFLVLGPMLDLKLLLMYTRVFRARLIGTIVACTVLQTLLYCLIFHAVFASMLTPPAPAGTPPTNATPATQPVSPPSKA